MRAAMRDPVTGAAERFSNAQPAELVSRARIV